jgi:hypothetical protein
MATTTAKNPRTARKQSKGGDTLTKVWRRFAFVELEHSGTLAGARSLKLVNAG